MRLCVSSAPFPDEENYLNVEVSNADITSAD